MSSYPEHSALTRRQMLRQSFPAIAAPSNGVEHRKTPLQNGQPPICQRLHVPAIFSLSKGKSK